MLDIQYIRDNAQKVAEKSKQKGYETDIPKLLEADTQRRTLLTRIEELRQHRNEQADEFQKQKPTEEQLATGRKLKEELAGREAELEAVQNNFMALLKQVPNVPLDEVPIGASEEQNQVAKTVGEPTKFDFQPQPHWELTEPRDLVDKARAVKIAGSRFAYLKGGLVRLQFAIIQFVLQTLADEQVISKLIEENGLHITAKPFMPILPPAMLRTQPYQAS